MEQAKHEIFDKIAPERVMIHQLDIVHKEDVKTMVQCVKERFGRVDILVNNAGANFFDEPVTLSDEIWEKCLDVNLKGSWNCSQAVLPLFLERNYGHVVNIASIHGHKIIRDSFPYPVAKHGLLGMTKALGIQYADKGVRFNSISPGLILTPAAQRYFDSQEDPVAAEKEQAELLPCKRIGTSQEVALTALFLASDEARFINATDILIDGGRSQVYHD